MAASHSSKGSSLTKLGDTARRLQYGERIHGWLWCLCTSFGLLWEENYTPVSLAQDLFSGGEERFFFKGNYSGLFE
jgi:hypothetical protein